MHKYLILRDINHLVDTNDNLTQIENCQAITSQILDEVSDLSASQAQRCKQLTDHLTQSQALVRNFCNNCDKRHVQHDDFDSHIEKKVSDLELCPTSRCLQSPVCGTLPLKSSRQAVMAVMSP